MQRIINTAESLGCLVCFSLLMQLFGITFIGLWGAVSKTDAQHLDTLGMD